MGAIFLLCIQSESFVGPNVHSMCGDRAKPPKYLSGDTIQFQHCRVFLSHLGMLSWSKR